MTVFIDNLLLVTCFSIKAFHAGPTELGKESNDPEREIPHLRSANFNHIFKLNKASLCQDSYEIDYLSS